MSTAPRSATALEDLRLHFLERCTALLEGQVRSHSFAAGTAAAACSEHRIVLDGLSRLDRYRLNAPARALLAELTHRSRGVQGTLDLLARERHASGLRDGDSVKEMIREFQSTAAELSSTLMEKSLLARQSKVLESIILSHENVARWELFVQHILADFHAVFPFNFFIVAFSEAHSLNLHLYFMNAYSDAIRSAVRERYAQAFLDELGLPRSAHVDVEEFVVGSDAAVLKLDALAMVSLAMPEELPRISGILGVAYAWSGTQGAQEQAIIRSILAVMMMVVGSSKMLTHTITDLEYYSTHDPLTGLYNRRQFNQMLEYEIARSERHGHHFCLLFLDLDDFKDINDSFGHPMGDSVLRRVGETLQQHLRRGDIVCRVGGDEFAVLLPETDLEAGMRVGDHVREAVQRLAFTDVYCKVFHTSASVGVVSYPRDARVLDELVASVDICLFRAKKRGKNTTASLDSAKEILRETRVNRTNIEVLRQALRQDRVVPYFQPIVHVASGQLLGYECVARLLGESARVIEAAQFIETAEKYGLAHDVDRAIIEHALQQKIQQMRTGSPYARFFINISAQEIETRGVIDYAERCCERLGVPPSSLVFEILEREAIGNMSSMRLFLETLRQRGFAFALDDFGSGYNSFHYLRELHFEYVKLDGAFVRNILASTIDHALVRNLVNLCHDLRIQTIAEFVESAAVLDCLRDMGVDYVQGNFIGEPGPQLA